MPVTVTPYNNFVEDVARGRINLISDTFKVILVNSGYTFSGAHADLAAVTASQLSTANGYTAGGATLANKTVSYASGVTKWDADDVTWTASGGSIGPATGAIIYDDTSTSPTADRLVCYIDFGGAQTAGNGTDMKIFFNAAGILNFTQ